MADEENKSEGTGDSPDNVAGDSGETSAAAVKKAAPKKKAARKKAVKKRAANPAEAKQDTKPETTGSNADAEEKPTTMGMMADNENSASEPPHKIGWKALVMIAVVVVVFMYIRHVAKPTAGDEGSAVDTATVPAEVLNATNATQGQPGAQMPAPAPSAGQQGQLNPWLLPPTPQQPSQGATNVPQPQPYYYYPAPPQGYYGYPYAPQRQPYPAQPPQGAAGAAPVQPYYPAPPQQGYYGYPYPPQPQPYPAPYQQ